MSKPARFFMVLVVLQVLNAVWYNLYLLLREAPVTNRELVVAIWAWAMAALLYTIRVK